MKDLTNKQIIKFIWSYFRRFPLMVFGAYFFVTVSYLADLLNPFLTGQVIAAIQDPARPIDARFHEAIFWVLMLGIQGVIFHVTYRIANLFNCYTDSRIEALVATEALERVQHFSTDWHNNSFAGSTVTKIKRGMRAAHTFYDIICYDIYPALGVIIGLVIMNSFKNPILGIIFGVFAVLFVIVSVTLALNYVAPERRKANKEDNQVGATLADTVTCNATVKTFGMENRELGYFSSVVEKWRISAKNAWLSSNILSTFQNVLIMGFKFVLFAGAVWLWYQGKLSLADVVFVISTYLVFTGYFRPIGDRIRDLNEAMNDIEDVVAFQHTHIDVKDLPNAEDIKIIQGKIEFKNVSFHYPYEKKNIYKNFSLTIEPGEKVALVGHSGSGKSTMVKLIQRLFNIQEGNILIDGTDIATVNQSSLRKNVALVPQDPILFHRSLRENIAYAKAHASLAEIDQAAKLAYAYEFIAALPSKYETLVGERGIKLSGGERQRVSIARAMLANCPIIILDEATSSLDSQSEAYIQAALKNLLESKTAIIIAHRLSTIKSVDRILVFEKGKIVEQGTHKALVKKEGGVYKKLYEMQVGGFLSE